MTESTESNLINCDGCGKEFDGKLLDENSICKDCKRCKCACHYEFDTVIICRYRGGIA